MFNITDPESGIFNVAWVPDLNTIAGDYSWQLNYTGSTRLRPTSVIDSIRIQGRANVTVTVGSEWTERAWQVLQALLRIFSILLQSQEITPQL